jgi:hypothetical protein
LLLLLLLLMLRLRWRRRRRRRCCGAAAALLLRCCGAAAALLRRCCCAAAAQRSAEAALRLCCGCAAPRCAALRCSALRCTCMMRVAARKRRSGGVERARSEAQLTAPAAQECCGGRADSGELAASRDPFLLFSLARSLACAQPTRRAGAARANMTRNVSTSDSQAGQCEAGREARRRHMVSCIASLYGSSGLAARK